MKLTSTRLYFLNRWLSPRRGWWYKNTPSNSGPQFTGNEWDDRSQLYQFRFDTGYERLADLLVLPRLYLTDSRMPVGFTLDKTVTIPSVGNIHFHIYGSREEFAYLFGARRKRTNTFIRFYMDCPFCGKHLPVSRFHQHDTVHRRQLAQLQSSNG